MSNLDNITSKILKDAEERKNEILQESEKKCREIIDAKTLKAKEIAQEIIKKAEEEGKLSVERLLSTTALDLRNQKLKAKQQLIDKAFQKAILNLEAMNDSDFESFMEKALLSLDIAGDEEIIISQDERSKLSEKFLNNINDKLIGLGKEGKLSFKADMLLTDRGFKLAKQGVEINYTFKELVNSLRYEMEYQVGNVLFNK